jgi:hypothetical protein
LRDVLFQQESRVLEPKRLKVINLFGPPGVGKSATRAGVFWLMKSQHRSIEEVTEFAKYLVLTDQVWRLRDEQVFCLAEQTHRQLILRGQYDYAITDSPLVLQPFYANAAQRPALLALALQSHHEFDNTNFYLSRNFTDAAFETNGRRHNQVEAERIDGEIRDYLQALSIPVQDVAVDALTPWRIVEALLPGLVTRPIAVVAP